MDGVRDERWRFGPSGGVEKLLVVREVKPGVRADGVGAVDDVEAWLEVYVDVEGEGVDLGSVEGADEEVEGRHFVGLF